MQKPLLGRFHIQYFTQSYSGEKNKVMKRISLLIITKANQTRKDPYEMADHAMFHKL